MVQSMSLNAINNLLLKLTPKVYHYAPEPNTEPAYIVWQEDGANDFLAGNRHVEKAFTGTIDLYTLEDGDPLIEAIPKALNQSETIAWYLNSIQYEEDTELIHYEWVWETYG